MACLHSSSQLSSQIILNCGSHWKHKNFDKSWFFNLLTMQALRERDEVDAPIIGARAYGLPLGFSTKKTWRKAVVLGRASQSLSGTSGGRWESREKSVQLMNSQ